MTEQATSHPAIKDKAEWLKSKIRDIPDFPKPGIIFKDITTLLKDKEAFRYVIDAMAEQCAERKPDYIAGIEARGFILGPAIAHKLGVGFIPVRKPGKLPYKVIKETYQLEYGTDTLEVHEDAVNKGDRVVLIDDLLATGGTAAAASSLLKNVGADLVGIGFVIELSFLGGKAKLPAGVDVFALLNY